MASPNGVFVYGPGATVTDAAGNTYTITPDNRLMINGQLDPPSAGVQILAFYNGQVYQRNDQNLWYSQSAPNYAVDGWTDYGAGVHPVPFDVSPDRTTVTPNSGGSITDADGNQWTIRNGQVVSDGVVDEGTANVIKLAIVKGVIWQENSDGLWWAKTNGPGNYDGWTSGVGITNADGSPNSPLGSSSLTNNWIADNAHSTDPSAWSDGVPTHGQMLSMQNGTMVIQADTLAGDALNIPDDQVSEGNVSLQLMDGSTVTVSGTSFYGCGFAVSSQPTGSNKINFNNYSAIQGSITVGGSSMLTSTGSMNFMYSGTVAADGLGLVNNGTLSFHSGTISGHVLGSGQLNLYQYHDGKGTTTVNATVDANQTVNVEADYLGTEMDIGDPAHFAAQVNITPQGNSTTGFADILLKAVQGDKYDYTAGKFSLFKGADVVDTMMINNKTSLRLDVYQMPSGVMLAFEPTRPSSPPGIVITSA